MLEQALFALVRATLLAELPAGVAVKQTYNPVTVGVPSTPTLFMQTIIPARRVGWLGRRDRNTPTENMTHEETQWLETTLQISALARRDPADPNFLTLPGAADYAQTAADILQGDKGLAALAVQGVRPLRITEVRTVQFVNDAQQYEANPSFDIVLSHVQIRESTTPAVSEFEGNAANV